MPDSAAVPERRDAAPPEGSTVRLSLNLCLQPTPKLASGGALRGGSQLGSPAVVLRQEVLTCRSRPQDDLRASADGCNARDWGSPCSAASGTVGIARKGGVELRAFPVRSLSSTRMAGLPT